MGKVETGVSLTPENHAFAKASGNISKTLNDLLDKVRNGQFVDAEAITSGDALYNCIFHMPSTDGKLDMQCPVKMEHPQKLAGDDNLGDLLTCCRQCPRKAEYLALAKLRLLYPSTFKEQVPESAQPAAQSTAKPAADHVEKQPSIPAPERRKEPVNNGKRVVCDSCKEHFATFLHDIDALDRLLEKFEEHLKTRHGGRLLSVNEANQFRALRVKA